MSNAQSPYTTPESTPQPNHQHNNPQLAPKASSVPKVMGILHIILAALGILLSITAFFSSKLMELMPKGITNLPEGYNELLEKSITYSYVDATVKIILGILLIIAGIKLLKYQSKGVKLSNIWAVIRIIWAVAIITFSYSNTVKMQQLLMANNPELSSALKIGNTIGLVSGILIVCIYPILSLILLNKSSVRKSLH